MSGPRRASATNSGLRVSTVDGSVAALGGKRTTAVVVRADPFAPAADSGAWRGAAVAEVSELEATRDAPPAWDKARKEQETRL